MCTHVSFSKVTVALLELSAASDDGVTDSDEILPLLKVRLLGTFGVMIKIPETEEVSHFFLTCLMSNVLDL